MRKLLSLLILAIGVVCVGFTQESSRYSRQFKSYTEQTSGDDLKLRSAIVTIHIVNSYLSFGDQFIKGFVIDSIQKDTASGGVSILTKDNWMVYIGRDDVKLISPKKDTTYRFHDPIDMDNTLGQRRVIQSEVRQPYKTNDPDNRHGMPIHVPSGEGFNMPVHVPDSTSHGFLLIAGDKKQADNSVLLDSKMIEQILKDTVNSSRKK